MRLKPVDRAGRKQYNTDQLNKIRTWISQSMELMNLMIEAAGTDPVEPRYFKGAELLKATGVKSQSNITNAVNRGAIPEPVLAANGQRLGYTLDQVLEIQEYFGTVPGRKDGDPCAVLAFINFKGGCWKTTTAQHAATYYANLGFRVLVVDLDPQASLTASLGIRPDIDTNYWNTMAAYFDDAVMDDGTECASVAYVESCIQETYLPTLDIIPASLDLAECEFSLAAEQINNASLPGRQAFDTFYKVKEAIGYVKEDYDIVIVDGTPSLGMIPMNILLAATNLIVPVPTERNDFISTQAFCRLYVSMCEKLRAVVGDDELLPNMFFVGSRYSKSRGADEILDFMKDVYKDHIAPEAIRKHDAGVGNLTQHCRTVFDIKAGEVIDRKQRTAALENYEEVLDFVLENAVYADWPSRATAQGGV